jgi:hypothetical protein
MFFIVYHQEKAWKVQLCSFLINIVQDNAIYFITE